MIAIAIDGPSGAGKSTIARKAAKAFGFVYVDTGAIYRTIGLAARERGIDSLNAADVIKMLPELKIELKYNSAGEQRMYLNGRDVSDDIRRPEISMLAAAVSAVPEVREYLLDMQRDMARHNDVIMDGRDIGTVILPNADLKIFLTASVEDRARRRYDELIEKGQSVKFADVLHDMAERDEHDSARAAAPLKPAEDAVLLDTTGNTLPQSVKAVCDLISERTGRTSEMTE